MSRRDGCQAEQAWLTSACVLMSQAWLELKLDPNLVQLGSVLLKNMSGAQSVNLRARLGLAHVRALALVELAKAQ